MRYWEPSIAGALESIRREGFRRLVLLPLYPQESRSTTGSCLTEARRALRRMGFAPDVREIRSFWEEPGFLEAMASSAERAMAGLPPGARVLYCAHGLPLVSARDDPYPGQVESTVRSIQERLRWRFPFAIAWQSRVGPMRWLEPSVETVMRRWAAVGVRQAALAPVAFVSEHSETLYELDILYAGMARRLGMEVARVPTVRCTPVFIRGLARRVGAALG